MSPPSPKKLYLSKDFLARSVALTRLLQRNSRVPQFHIVRSEGQVKNKTESDNNEQEQGEESHERFIPDSLRLSVLQHC
jgi:ribosomal protein L39E